MANQPMPEQSGNINQQPRQRLNGISREELLAHSETRRIVRMANAYFRANYETTYYAIRNRAAQVVRKEHEAIEKERGPLGNAIAGIAEFVTRQRNREVAAQFAIELDTYLAQKEELQSRPADAETIPDLDRDPSIKPGFSMPDIKLWQGIFINPQQYMDADTAPYAVALPGFEDDPTEVDFPAVSHFVQPNTNYSNLYHPDDPSLTYRGKAPLLPSDNGSQS